MGSPYNPLHTVVKEGLLRVYPDECLVCHLEGQWLCRECLESLVPIKSPTCPFCNRLTATGATCKRCSPNYYLNGNLARWYYRDAVKSILRSYKYRAITAPTEELVKHLVTLVPLLPHTFDIITSVPSLPSKWRQRGFNQSELLAKEVARVTNALYKPLLTRQPANHAQVGLSRPERFANVANQFSCTSQLNKEKILIIDDVITTGATINACAKALKESGSGLVWSITLAKD